RALHYGDLAGVDPTKSVTIDAQAQALPFPPELELPGDYLTALSNPQSQVPSHPVLLSQQATDKLELRIHKVKCLDETNGFLGSEAGADEIDLGGTTVDESGDTEKVDAFRVRSDFEDGVEQIYSPPKQFASFDLKEGTEFPKSYFVTLVLAEIDNGGLPDFLNDLLNWVKGKVEAALGAALGAAIGATGGPVGAIIGTAVGAVTGWVVGLLKSIWEDDIFAPATVSVEIPALSARWSGDETASPESVVTFEGHGGKYQLTFDWRMFGPPLLEPPTLGGVIYAIQHRELDPTTGRPLGSHLLWYRHDGRGDASFRWAPGSGNMVGSGWNFKQVFSGGDGIIYTIQENGDLLWYRHEGRGNGSAAWAAGSGKKVGNGWDFLHVYSG
ncbi:MAG TPA: tachylectin-related carbohydrate-binding protein, partial [Bryobacteraceae bacterium]|nr:tachylectin-related carbohydrate-binding protein [Bryobacteraceae bacterium]